MIHDEEFDLFWADKPPGWVQNFGLMMELWGNPVFQRRYVMWRLYPYFGVKKSFLIGLAASLVINLALRIFDPENAMGLGLLITVVVPGIVALSVTGMRFFLSCLVGTPMELRRELYSGMLGAVLASPISDEKIFVSECVSGIMRGLGAFEEILAMIVGLALPFLVVHSPGLWAYVSELGIITVWWIVFAIMVIAIIIILNVMTTFAAGLYSIALPVAAAIPTTLLHVAGIFWLHFGIITMIYMYLSRFELITELPPLIHLLVNALFLIFTLSAGTILTSHGGTMAFANARRPGYYEPERARSSNFIMRNRPDRVQFGDRI